MRTVLSLALVAFFLLTCPQSVLSARSDRLREAMGNPEAVRTEFFVEGMVCRACTMIIDRSLNKREGVYWARYNYPVRKFVIFHDPALFPVDQVKQEAAAGDELTLHLVSSRPAGEKKSTVDGNVVIWNGGAFGLDEALDSPRPFAKTLQSNYIQKGSEEYAQVMYEIIGETVRSRIFLELAKQAGYEGGDSGTPLPMVIAKDFYWPVEALPLTGDEAAVARFISDKVLLGEDNEVGRERFDQWLSALWKKIDLDFRAELVELEP